MLQMCLFMHTLCLELPSRWMLLFHYDKSLNILMICSTAENIIITSSISNDTWRFRKYATVDLSIGMIFDQST